jgi:ABC-2 type transport system ATP-binding protein
MFYLVIRTENLTKYYGHHLGVQNLTLEVEPGEVFGFLGTAGAGKSTTIRMLLDFVRPTSGRALVLGRDVRRHSLEVRRQVGFLPAAFSFGGHLTGEDGLRYLAGLRADVSWPYVCELSERLGVNLARKVTALTPADKQKLGLVQAFMHRPELLILDEPAQGLDADAQNALFHLISEARLEGRSVFLATQSLHDVERICDRVGILRQGSLVAVERTVRLRGRSLRRVEMRFAGPVSADLFARLNNVENVHIEDNLLSCTVRGDPDALIKLASQYRITDFICQQPALEEVVSRYYGEPGYAAA